jgi:hypothetical protein
VSDASDWKPSHPIDGVAQGFERDRVSVEARNDGDLEVCIDVRDYGTVYAYIPRSVIEAAFAARAKLTEMGVS